MEKELSFIQIMARLPTKTFQIVNQPDFPKIRIGRKIRIPEKELELFLLYKPHVSSRNSKMEQKTNKIH